MAEGQNAQGFALDAFRRPANKKLRCQRWTGKVGMTIDFDVKWRYALYAAVMVPAAAAYLLLDADGAVRPAPQARRSMEAGLPALRGFDYAAEAQQQRDLFAFVTPAGESVEAAAPAPPPAGDERPAPSLLANLKVVGLVERPGEISILLQAGTALRSVAPGEPFGDGDALSVNAIRGRYVQIVDSAAKISKTFELSEE